MKAGRGGAHLAVMIDIRPFASLGHADHGWLDARHHFSFANYHDPARMGWGAIRVWNDDRIAAQVGLSAAPPPRHGNHHLRPHAARSPTRIRSATRAAPAAGDVQVMSAGTGVTHAEYNLEDEETTLFQIWIETDRRSAAPSWGMMPFPKEARDGSFQTARQRRPPTTAR